ncbi:hypothetical protein Y032_0017g3261 [Ancylostoma ceylanicum]|uniref:SCP domain-containing protein n=1 Tax=Ancylostoma ceylanicum TaxID=53326 RepID=A0A016V5J5_9BILA|nr:hypothetical protein Y032_0017g3261 [Ancylostoma ceylanicum]
MLVAYLVQALLLYDVAISFATSSGLEKKTFSDEWRNVVLKFHNERRRRLAKGMQPTAGGKLMPYAKDMHELVSDFLGHRVRKC